MKPGGYKGRAVLHQCLIIALAKDCQDHELLQPSNRRTTGHLPSSCLPNLALTPPQSLATVAKNCSLRTSDIVFLSSVSKNILLTPVPLTIRIVYCGMCVLFPVLCYPQIHVFLF